MMQIVIIGNGVAGITAARHIRKKSDHQITVISGESKYFFSRTALMYVYMGHMKFEHIKPYEDWFWEKNRIRLIHNSVINIDFEKKECWLGNGEVVAYDKLVIASGSKPNTLGINFSKVKGAQGLYSLQDLELMEKNTKGISDAVIVGGGLIGIEMAEMLRSRNIRVTFLVMEKSYWHNAIPMEESAMITAHIREHHIIIKTETQVYNINQDESGRVTSIVTDHDETLPCQFLGVTVGVSPNVDFLRNSEVATSRGVLVNEYFETTAPDVYAIGDCVEFQDPKHRQFRIEQLWYTARMHGEVVAQSICGNRTAYDRGIWFNSAKFLDIEFQTYGFVPNKITNQLNSFYWQHSSENKCMRIVYEESDKTVVGFNFLGMRYRQEVCQRWIREKRTIDYAIKHLGEGNFDPEFGKRYEGEIVKKFMEENHGVEHAGEKKLVEKSR